MIEKLSKNLKLTLQRKDDEQSQAEGILFGAIEGKSLIAGGFGDVDFTVGEELVVRISTDGSIYWFWTKIMEKVDFEGSTYFLSYPKQMESLDQRKVPRMQVFIPVNAILSTEVSGDANELKGALTDLSLDGCCLQSPKDRPENASCVLTFSLPGTNEVYELKGEVVRLVSTEAFKRYGMKFVQNSKGDSNLSKLQDWVKNNQSFGIHVGN